MTSRKSVQGGYCLPPDTGGCQLTKEHCDDPANFRSSRQMQTAPAMAHDGSCRWQDSVRETVVGRCDTDGGCASERHACPEGDSGTALWAWPEPECTVETTRFGRCDYGMCAWSHDHCDEDNTWDAFDEGCTCDNVQVGACYRWINNDQEREVFCAVSEQACDEEQSWIAPQELYGAVGYNCFLCREETATRKDTIANVDLESDFEIPALSESDVIKVIIVGSILGTIVALCIICCVARMVFKSKRAAKRGIDGGAFENKEEEGTPTGAIEVSSGILADGNNASA